MIRKIYENVKQHFGENINWIYEDFFKDEVAGLEYFTEELKRDPDYVDFDFSNISDEKIKEISDDIIQKLKTGADLGSTIMFEVDRMTDKYIGDGIISYSK